MRSIVRPPPPPQPPQRRRHVAPAASQTTTIELAQATVSILAKGAQLAIGNTIVLAPRRLTVQTGGLALGTTLGLGRAVVGIGTQGVGLTQSSTLLLGTATLSTIGRGLTFQVTIPSATLPSSQTYLFELQSSDLLLEAFARIQLRPPALTATHLLEARRSVNLELQTWANRGVNLWAVQQAQLPLVAGQISYPLPANCIEVLDVWYSIPNTALGGSATIDRILMPISRTDYARYPTKTLLGLPTVYWFDRLLDPNLVIWQPDATGPPNVINYFYLRQMQDYNATVGQTVDMPLRFLDALCAALARRLARKYAPPLVADLAVEAKEAWQSAAGEDRELAPIFIRPDLSQYYRM